jgi:hypothetical protein
MIGGASPVDGNLISGNRENGVLILNLSSQNLLHNNIIGLDLEKQYAVPNATGILIGSSSTENSIGQPSVARGNTISGNLGAGISIQNAGNNAILGNVIGGLYIGSGGPGNGGDGISISGISESNRIGDGTFSGDNTINYNRGDGVRLDGAATKRNPISQNEIFDNAGLPIRILNGAQEDVTPPSLEPVLPGEPIFGFSSALGSVEFYELDDSGFFFLERVVVDAKGGFQTSSPIVRNERSLVVATVTDANQNTSEFSATQVIPATLNATPVQLLNLYLEFDSNFDELLNLAEYQAGTGRDSASFTAADTNADGLLSFEEIFVASVLESSFTQVEVTTLSDVADAPSTDSLSALLLDSGSDGKISLREVLLATQSEFNVYVKFSEAGTIQPVSELPPVGPISARIYIDGRSEVVLDGALLSGERAE